MNTGQSCTLFLVMLHMQCKCDVNAMMSCLHHVNVKQTMMTSSLHGVHTMQTPMTSCHISQTWQELTVNPNDIMLIWFMLYVNLMTSHWVCTTCACADGKHP